MTPEAGRRSDDASDGDSIRLSHRDREALVEAMTPFARAWLMGTGALTLAQVDYHAPKMAAEMLGVALAHRRSIPCPDCWGPQNGDVCDTCGSSGVVPGEPVLGVTAPFGPSDTIDSRSGGLKLIPLEGVELVEVGTPEQLIPRAALQQVGWRGPYGLIPGGMDVDPAPHWEPVFVECPSESPVDDSIDGDSVHAGHRVAEEYDDEDAVYNTTEAERS